MATNNYVLLERITVGANGASSVTFNNIPQTGYTDLKIVYSARSDAATTDRGMFVRFNGDSGSNYSYKFVRGDGSSAGSGGTTTSFLYFGNFNAGTSTSNTFGNGEFYIPNYRGSTQKSVSSDSVSENNATGAWTTLAAGLWTGTSAISTILLYPEGGNFVQYSTFSLYALAAVGITPTTDPKALGGDIIQTDGTYWYHAFLSSGTFTPKAGTNLTCDILQVAGGGAGGAAHGAGGGGAGGVLAFTSQSLTANTAYTAIIGAGGASVTGSGQFGGDGTSSQFGALTASVGGGGGSPYWDGTNASHNGGSGGGGGYYYNTNNGTGQTGGTGVSGQGKNGGTGYASGSTVGHAGGGGGGAAANGANASANVGGNGGAGVNTYTGWGSLSAALTATGLGSGGYIAGGGGGSVQSGTRGTGGSGGGGNGAISPDGSTTAPTVGAPNTGSGGGAASWNSGTTTGGSGLIIVRYLA